MLFKTFMILSAFMIGVKDSYIFWIDENGQGFGFMRTRANLKPRPRATTTRLDGGLSIFF